MIYSIDELMKNNYTLLLALLVLVSAALVALPLIEAVRAFSVTGTQSCTDGICTHSGTNCVTTKTGHTTRTECR
jgi:hypothetical protein